MQYVGMQEQDKGSHTKNDIAPGRWICRRNADVQQHIARHAQVCIQPAVHNQSSQFGSVAKDAHRNAESAGRDGPEYDDICVLPAMHQWELAEVGPQEKEPQTIISYHRENLRPESRA